MKRFFHFISKRDDLKRKLYVFNISVTIESMLKTFLKEFNSKIPLDQKYIIFTYNSKILNSEKYLHKKVSDVFENGNRDNFIKVSECGNIVYKPSIGDTFIKFEDYKCYFKLLYKNIFTLKFLYVC